MARTNKRAAVAADLRSRIESGSLGPGDQLPTEAELGDQHDVSRITVRAALHSLAERGLIHSIRGHGWYVRDDQRLRYPLLRIDSDHRAAHWDAWHAFVGQLGSRAEAQLDVYECVPPPEITRRLKLTDGEHAFGRRRVRLVDGRPWMISVGWYPAWLAYGTPLAQPDDMQDPSPVAWLAANGSAPVREEDDIGARMPTPAEVDMLAVGRGVPVITNHRTSWDLRGRPIRCTADVMPAHRFTLLVERSHTPARFDDLTVA